MSARIQKDEDFFNVIDENSDDEVAFEHLPDGGVEVSGSAMGVELDADEKRELIQWLEEAW